jgi:hypothetical protein
MKKLLIPILVPILLAGHLFAVAGPEVDPVLEAAREAASDEGSTAATVAQAAKDAAIAEGLTGEEANREAARASSRAVAEKEFETSGNATLAGTKARDAALAAGVDEAEADAIAGEEAAEGVAEKAIAEGKTATEVAEETKRAAEGAGLDAEAAKEKAAEVATEKITEKAIADGKSASQVAAEARAAAEGAGLDAEAAKEKAADIATEKITEKALADGESIEAVAGKARAAAEGAGLDAEAAKDRAADVAAEKVAEKAIADGKTAAEAGAEALAAAKAAGVSDEVAKEKAGSRAADIAAREALEKGLSEEEAKQRAKDAAKGAGIDDETAASLAQESFDDAKENVGNRTPDVSNVTAAQLIGTKLLRINYDLSVSDGRACTVTIRWSTDNGENFDLTATAVTGDVGPGVAPGKDLEATWDMGVDWDNKYTEDGRIEVIASRISPVEDNLVIIPAEGASWDLANEKKDLVVTLPAEVLSPQEVDWIKEAREHERLLWVDVRFPVGDNDEEGFFWGSENVFIGPDGKVILVFPHTSALDAPGVNLLDIETFAYNGDTLRLNDLPPKGTPTLRLEFTIDVPEDWQEEGEGEVESEDHRSGLPLSNALVLLDQSEGEISLFSGLLQPLVDEGDLAGGSISNADRIYTTGQNGDAIEIYYYQVAPIFAGGNGWRKLGASASSDQKDSVLLVAGEGHPTFAVLIRERAAEEGDVLQVYSDPHHYEIDLSGLSEEDTNNAAGFHVRFPIPPGELEQPK